MSEFIKRFYEKVKTFEIQKKRIVLCCAIIAALICTMSVFIYRSVETYDDSQHVENTRINLVTKFPLDIGSFFEEFKPNIGIVLSWHDNTIKLGEENENNKLSGVLYPITVADRSLTYTSSNSDIAEIDSEGNITAKNPGSVEITVSNEYTGVNAKAYLQVVQPVTSFYLQKSTITMYTTDTGVRLASQINPENASNTAVQWYSKDTDIVQVDQTGRLKPINTGMTEVVAKTTDGGFSSKCFVNVINEIIKAESVEIQNKGDIKLNKGESWLPAVSVLPSNARNKSVEWSTSDEKVATVTKTGKVTAVGGGKAVITAKSPDGPSDSVEITVNGSVSSADNFFNMNGSADGGVNYVTYNMTLEDMAKLQMTLSPPPKNDSGYASLEETMEYIDPNEYCMGAYKYQFLDLSHYNGVSEDDLNRYLENKGILRGQAAAFIEAAKTYNISEIYLVAHACLETGNGTSQLATGVSVNGVTVYNMFGIAAYDNSALSSGSQKAYKEGWTSPEAAIIGGAEWISKYYINSADGRQNTLYKMRWNPDNPGEHMYATDIGWAVKQALIMERMIAEFPDASLSYEIPVYYGSNAAVIDE